MSRRSVFRSVSALASTAVLMGAGAVAAEAAPVAHAAGGSTVKVAAGSPGEFAFKLSTKSAKAGAVTFKVTNKGKITHDFSIDHKTTPMLKPGKSATLKVTLKKGSYPYECTVTGHAQAGMKGTFKVS